MRRAKKLLLIYSVAMALALALVTMHSRPASASEVGSSKKFGIGGMLGAPTGLSMKFYLSQSHAIDVGVGLGFWGGATVYVHADYLFHFMLTRHSKFDLPFYIGLGAKLTVWFTDHDHYYWGDKDRHGGYIGVGARVPIGIAFNLNSLPLDIFLEIVPGIGFFPGIGGFIDGAVGVRYYL